MTRQPDCSFGRSSVRTRTPPAAGARDRPHLVEEIR